MRSPALVVAAAAAALCLAGCPEAPKVEPLSIPAGCSPLAADIDCGVPYPSDFFLVDDAGTPSGKRVHFEDVAKLLTAHNFTADVNDTFTADGFSPVTPIVFSLGVAVDPKSASGIFDDAAQTTQKGFKTALIDAATGERIPHFVDVDPLATDLSRQGLIMHVLVRLKEKTRYVVAISGLEKADGGEAPPTEAFRRLRDGKDAVGEDKVLAPLLARYEKDVFPVLDADGLDRKKLQLAWDFTTGSDENAVHDMLHARALALADLAVHPPVVTVQASFEGDNLAAVLGNDHADNAFRLIRGTITGPRIVDNDVPGAKLNRAGGEVALNGNTTFEFSAIVPASVAAGTEPAAAMMFGHGFFGDRSEMEGIAARNILDHAGVVGVAIDWHGMSVDDIGHVVENVGGDAADKNPSKAIDFADRVMQSMVNWMTVTHAVKAGLLNGDPAFQRADGTPFVDVDKPMGFTGISLGHVLGGTLCALDPELERCVLMVGGAAFSTMMYRARPFDRFLFLLQFSVPDALDQQKLAAQMQSPFDRFDPASFAPYVVGADLPEGPTNNFDKRRVLMMMGVGDAQVPNVASELHARLMGVPLMTPAAGRAVFGLDEASYPREGSGFVIFDLGVDDGFYEQARSSPEGNIIHEGVRRVPQSLDMVHDFFQAGVIDDVCGGACVVDPNGLDIPSG